MLFRLIRETYEKSVYIIQNILKNPDKDVYKLLTVILLTYKLETCVTLRTSYSSVIIIPAYYEPSTSILSSETFVV